MFLVFFRVFFRLRGQHNGLAVIRGHFEAEFADVLDPRHRPYVFPCASLYLERLQRDIGIICHPEEACLPHTNPPFLRQLSLDDKVT